MFFEDVSQVQEIAGKCGTAVFVVPDELQVEISQALVLQPEEKTAITIEQVRGVMARLELTNRPQSSFMPFLIAGVFYFVANYLVEVVMARIETSMDYYITSNWEITLMKYYLSHEATSPELEETRRYIINKEGKFEEVIIEL